MNEEGTEGASGDGWSAGAPSRRRAGAGATVVGVGGALDGAVRPVADRTLVAAPAECETARAMAAVPCAADLCGGGGALGFASPGELP